MSENPYEAPVRAEIADTKPPRTFRRVLASLLRWWLGLLMVACLALFLKANGVDVGVGQTELLIFLAVLAITTVLHFIALIRLLD